MVFKKLILLSGVAVMGASCFSAQAMQKHGLDEPVLPMAKKARSGDSSALQDLIPSSLLPQGRRQPQPETAALPEVPVAPCRESPHEVSLSQDVPVEISVQATLRAGEMILLNRATAIDDEAAFRLFHKISQSPDVPVEISAQAALRVGEMRLLNRTMAIDDEAAFRLFHKISLSQDVPVEISEQAALRAGEMRLLNRTMAIGDEAAFRLFREVSRSQDVPVEISARAKLRAGEMRLFDRTMAIGDEAALQMFHEVMCQEIDARIRVKAALCKMRIIVSRIAPVLGYADVFQSCNEVSESQEASAADRESAFWLKKQMDVMAWQFFDEFSKNRAIPLEGRKQAALFKMKLIVAGRAPAIEDGEAFRLFNGVSQIQTISAADRACADLCKAIMRFERRTEAITDAEAYALFQGIFTNVQARQSDRKQASKFKEQMILDGRAPAEVIAGQP
jgi:hypothetical protein